MTTDEPLVEIVLQNEWKKGVKEVEVSLMSRS
jgi:hypothetical protein